MSGAVGYLLNDLCTECRFCIPPKDAEIIKEEKFLEADEFACKVLIAEGMNPEHEKRWRKKYAIGLWNNSVMKLKHKHFRYWSGQKHCSQ